ncbi:MULTISPECIES: polysaccharide biosynthesis/export family protein [unclassified Ruegeria]|uniref:polysaccharide biosynthesis/export family protein n=1 Tax=unclassified Ruegeria TaxID=2625375 RepID=UPI001ADD35B6|nr:MULTISPECIES: polysaccharide biosynthesis/export family protein [unclassified Ruegeria]MBO9411907.1 polysaccharide biosynthesis/export family protein [Ruegeria sp. R8_1]MBO9415532.1 polysaccharide biosynthesis/export family protein [Ruegeria sp. R8_2]
MPKIHFFLSVLTVIGLTAGCSTIYRSPSVTAGISDSGSVRVVPLTPETVLVANRSTYAPKTLPSVFKASAGSGAGTSQRGIGPLPDAPSTQEGSRAGLRLDPPPQVNPGAYTIGIGDVLVLSTPSTQGSAGELSGLLAAQNSRNGYTVQDDGSINIPDVGRVRLLGLTVDEAEAVVFQRLVENQIDPTFSLEIAEFTSRRVSIGGAVGKPGVQSITLNPLTLGEALAAAGSVSVSDIDNSSVRVYRDGQMYQIPLEDLYARTDLQNLNLIADDSVFVDTDYDLDRAERYFAQQIQLRETVLEGRRTSLQELSTAVDLRRDELNERRDSFIQSVELDAVDRDYVYLSGEVRTQGRYALPFNHRATLADALFDTGGGVAKETGDASEVYVLRASRDVREFGAVTAWHLDTRNAAHLTLAAQFELRNNDVIFIAENPVTRWSRTISQITPSLITTPIVAASN